MQNAGLTQRFVDWSNGDEQALSRLMPLVYAELSRVAAGYHTRKGNGDGS